MATQLNNLSILVNNEQVAYEANSLEWQDGFGEYNVRNAVLGGGQTEQVFSEALETKFGMVKFTMPTTVENEANKRKWKVNKNNNVVTLIGPPGSNFTKIFTQASISNDPTSAAATEGTIEIEFKSNPAQ